MVETEVAIVGGGPGGLGAALFTAKNELDTVVFDTDETPMHRAQLYNYLGIEEVSGTQFMETARRQVSDHGADLRQGEGVTDVEAHGNGFHLTTDDDEYEADYVVFATGMARDLVEDIDCEIDDDGTVAIDSNCETSLNNAYAVGWVVRDQKIEAAISVGHGTSAAIDILSKDRGEPFHDFDVAEED